MLAGGGRGERQGQVRRVRGRDDDHVDVRRAGSDVLGRGERYGAVVLRELRRARAARDGDEPRRPS